MLFVSVILYLLPNLWLFADASASSSTSSFYSTDGVFLTKLLLAPIFAMFLIHTTWCGPALTAWYGHIIFSNFQFKVTYLLITFFVTYWFAFLSSVHFSSTLIFDYTATAFNFFIWIWAIFFSDNVFTFVFFLEILSASITLLLTTSTFSSTHFYNNLSFSTHSYFQSSTPTAFLQTLMFFFWITLVSSLSLFLFIVLFYTKFLTFDWSLIDAIFDYLVTTGSLRALYSSSVSWFFLLLCIFLKCGIVPFYLWKPTFFKGMPLLTLFFYTYVYYFSIFLYFVYVLLILMNELFMFNLNLLLAFILIATLGITVLLFESFYLKAFLAMSSILNSIFILYMTVSLQSTDFLFLL